jgi:hypothetical protein
MATQSSEVLDRSKEAAADLSAKQYFAVKQSGAKQMALCGAVTDLTFGILQDKPKQNESGRVRVLGTSLAVTDGSGAAIAVNDKLGPNASGKLVKVTTADRPVAAIAMGVSTTDGAIIEVLLTPGTVYRVPA